MCGATRIASGSTSIRFSAHGSLSDHGAPGPRMSHPPSAGALHRPGTTLHHETSPYVRCSKPPCAMDGWRTFPTSRRPTRPRERSATRHALSPEEYKQLYEATRARTTRNRGRKASAHLHDYVLFMANTGLRPDEEASLVVSPRTCSSVSNAITPLRVFTSTGTIWSLKRPLRLRRRHGGGFPRRFRLVPPV